MQKERYLQSSSEGSTSGKNKTINNLKTDSPVRINMGKKIMKVNDIREFLCVKVERNSGLSLDYQRVLIIAAVNDYFDSLTGINNFEFQLKDRIIHFRFRKVDGSIREAWGTLKSSIIEDQGGIKGSGKRANVNCITYFDLERQDWRCLKKENLIEIL